MSETGDSVPDAIRQRLLRIADRERPPLTAPVPNAFTVEAMMELDEGKGERFGSVEELLRDLNIRVVDVPSRPR